MSLTYKGITPVRSVDTRRLQSQTPVAGTTWKVTGGKVSVGTKGDPGICMTLVCFWLSRLIEGEPVTSVSDFPSSFQLSIAQSAYEFKRAKADEMIMQRFGVEANFHTVKKAKWYMWGKKRLQQIAAATTARAGYYLFGAAGEGAHALGIRTLGAIQFFDPNEGILTFTSARDLATWLPPYMYEEYPDLRAEVELFGVGAS